MPPTATRTDAPIQGHSRTVSVRGSRLGLLPGSATGGSALSVGAEEAEWAWRVVTPVLEAWRQGRVPLEEYPAGSDGPPGGPHRPATLAG
jgi:hypothetical protein